MLWDKRWLQVNSVVIGSSGGESFCCFLFEDISVFQVCGWHKVFDGFDLVVLGFALGKGGGRIDLANGKVVIKEVSGRDVI